jgi:hypothetical protein
MKSSLKSRLLVGLALSLLFLIRPLPRIRAQEKAVIPQGGVVNITVSPAALPSPPVSITQHERHGQVTPVKGKCAHTGGGLIDVGSPGPDTIIVTMNGAVVANSMMQFELDQAFEVSFDDPKLKKAKLTIEARVIGLLRGERKGCAEFSEACASILAAPADLVTLCVPPHQICGCDSLAVNDHDGPKAVPILPGKYTLHQTFSINATTTSLICKRPSAEFAPDPALDPLWISYWDPFHGVKKDTFGFQVILKVAPDTDEGSGDKKAGESFPAPKEKRDAAVTK